LESILEKAPYRNLALTLSARAIHSSWTSSANNDKLPIFIDGHVEVASLCLGAIFFHL
jgi:hypothetical protein